MERPRSPNERRLRLGCQLALAALTLLAYSGSFDGDFVADDKHIVRDNPRLRSLDGPTVWEHLTEFHGANYHPVTMLSLAVDYALWGEETAGYHAVNLLLHGLCGLLVFSILCRLRLPTLAAAAVAALWTLHPLQVESVAWISERKNVLSGLFFLAAFRAWIDFSDEPTAGRYAALFALFTLAVLSKMNTLVLPAVALAFEACWRSRLRRRDLLATLPLFAVGAAVAAYNIAYSPVHDWHWHGGSRLITWLTSSTVIFAYLGKLVWPLDLRPYYPVPLRDSVLDPVVAASLLGLAALAVLAVWGLRRRRREVFWLAWFFIVLAPMLNIIPFRALMQDRYMHLAMLGPLAAAAMQLEPWARRHAVPVLGTVAVLVCACAALTHAQVELWSSQDSYEAASPMREGYEYLARWAESDPRSYQARVALAHLHWKRGENAEALRQQRRALELCRAAPSHPRRDPVCIDIQLGLARLLAQSGDRAAAVAQCKEILSRQPGHDEARQLLDQVRSGRL